MRTPCPFTRADLVRALKGAKEAGIPVTRIKITREGIEIDTAKQPDQQPPASDDAGGNITL